VNRNQPPCNTCSKHDCRSCAWTSPLDASYRKLVESHSLLSIVTLSVRPADRMPHEPSWLGIAFKYLAGLICSRRK
jgi:hypothetical protein